MATTYKEQAIEAAMKRFSPPLAAASIREAAANNRRRDISQIIDAAEPFIREAARKELEDRLLSDEAKEAAREDAESASVYSDLDPEYVAPMVEAAIEAALRTARATLASQEVDQ